MSKDAPKIKALAPWFGSKRTLAPKIVQELGPHSSYWEPFCGSMAILLSKPRARAENVNDLHGDLINLARVVQDGTLGPRFYRRARRILFHEEFLRDARDEMLALRDWDGELSVARALTFLVFSWMGRNGSAGLPVTERGGNVCVRWSSSGGEPGTRWLSVVESIPAWRRRLRGVTILKRDGFEVVAKIRDEPKVVIYVDPPYLAKSDAYRHDFKTCEPGSLLAGAQDDHARLAEALSRFERARVVVSYYEHPRLAELYPSSSWTKRDVPTRKYLANATGARRTNTEHVAPEVLLINGPSYAKADRPDAPLFGGEQ